VGIFTGATDSAIHDGGVLGIDGSVDDNENEALQNSSYTKDPLSERRRYVHENMWCKQCPAFDIDSLSHCKRKDAPDFVHNISVGSSGRIPFPLNDEIGRTSSGGIRKASANCAIRSLQLVFEILSVFVRTTLNGSPRLSNAIFSFVSVSPRSLRTSISSKPALSFCRWDHISRDQSVPHRLMFYQTVHRCDVRPRQAPKIVKLLFAHSPGESCQQSSALCVFVI